MYRFEHTNHDIFLNILFQNLCKLFSCVHNLHKLYFSLLGNSKNLYFQVMMLPGIFPNQAYIHKDEQLFAINILLSWLENLYVLKNCPFNFSSNLY